MSGAMGKGREGSKKKGKKGKGAAAPEDTHRCFHCDSEGARMCCSQCHLAWYCGKPCQKKHWKQHKKACVAAVAVWGKGGVDSDARRPRRATAVAEWPRRRA